MTTDGSKKSFISFSALCHKVVSYLNTVMVTLNIMVKTDTQFRLRFTSMMIKNFLDVVSHSVTLAFNKLFHFARANTIRTSKKNISEHYDLGNEFYQLFLDPSMTYSSGIFTSPECSLEAAQYEKYDALCRKLNLQPGDSSG